MGAHLSLEQRELARRLRREGKLFREIAAELGCSTSGAEKVVYTIGQREAARQHLVWSPGPRRLSLADREEISRGLVAGKSLREIARQLHRAPSTVAREIAGGGGRAHYRAVAAHHRAYGKARRPKPAKLVAGPLTEQVSEWLEQWWSPQAISRRLRLEFAGDPSMQVSHETIYQSLYVQGRGELRRELHRCLRSGRAHRRPHGRTERRPDLRDMVMISERPAEVADRAVPGHWEGDLVLGKNGRSAIATLVERQTRYVLLCALPDGRDASHVNTALRRAITTLPGHLVRSITWDQGRELARHVEFSVATGVQVYFCDPHSPWQRGSNENTNGLLRQYLPKGSDLSVHSQDDLDRIAHSLNNRPRATLGYLKPSEKLAELLR